MQPAIILIAKLKTELVKHGFVIDTTFNNCFYYCCYYYWYNNNTSNAVLHVL